MNSENVYVKVVKIHLSTDIDIPDQVQSQEEFMYLPEVDVEHVTPEIMENVRRSLEESVEKYWSTRGKAFRAIVVIRRIVDMTNQELAMITARNMILRVRGCPARDTLHEVLMSVNATH